MTKKICIIGAKGNMGQRYASILRYLNQDILLVDKDDWMLAVDDLTVDGFIIASPTESHYTNLLALKAKHRSTPILCEKPVTKNQTEIKAIFQMGFSKLQMVNQYAQLIDAHSKGPSHYKYFNSGRDGLEWDCINIICLSDTKPKLRKNSPFWTCMINGKDLRISEMDGAYVEMVKQWLDKPKDNQLYIRQAHNKVWDGFYT